MDSNAYADIPTLVSASYLNLTGAGEYTRLRKMMENWSRLLDKLTERFFYCLEGTRYYDGAAQILFLADDLLSVTSLKLDEDADGTYEATLAATDYQLYPLNTFPKSYAKIKSGGDYGGFADGIEAGVQIVGVFGHGDGLVATPYRSSGDAVADVGGITAAATTVAVTSGANFGAGQTLRIESEQVYVESIATNTLTIRRAMNGTTAATHVQTTAIYIYEYPSPIQQAVLIETSRQWKRKDEGFMTAQLGSLETGMLQVYQKLDPFTQQVVDRYRRRV